MRKEVDAIDGKEYQPMQEVRWESMVGKSTEYSAGRFLNFKYLPLNHGDMLTRSVLFTAMPIPIPHWKGLQWHLLHR